MANIKDDMTRSRFMRRINGRVPVRDQYFRIRKPQPLMCMVTVLVLGGLLLGAMLQQPSRTDAIIISGISPNSGPVEGGQTITITGSGFMAGPSWGQISAGYYHTCAIASNNTAYCWGDNNSGQLGDNRDSGPESPTPIPISADGSGLLDGKTVKQISAGYYHTCAIASDNTAYCWGENNSGQLGDNRDSGPESYIPVPISADGSGLLDGKTVKQISAGQYHTCAIASDNTAYCWGDNGSGKLGDDYVSGGGSIVPVPISADGSGLLDGKTVKQISAGSNHTCAIASDNTAYCWGDNGGGQLGDNQASGWESPTPIPISADGSGLLEGKTVRQISTGFYRTCAIASDGQAYCWGYNWFGQLGDGSYMDSSIPIAIDTTGALYGKTIKQISTGYYHTCAIASNNTAYCWGDNGNGKLGDDYVSGGGSIVPVPISADGSGLLDGETVRQITTINNHTCAIASNNTAYCWGDESHNQLGNGSYISSPVPVVVDTTYVSPPTLTVTIGGAICTNVTVISDTELTCVTPAHSPGSKDVSAAIGSIEIKTLSDDSYTYMLPLPTITDINPNRGPVAGGQMVEITGTNFMTDTNWKQISTGKNHTCAIASDDTAYCWGDNGYGQLGDNSTVDSFVPIAIDTTGVLSGKTIKQISAGDRHTCAIANDDTAYCWGRNNYGQLGDNRISGSRSTTPVPISANSSGLLNGKTVKQISAGKNYGTCAIASDDTAYCWGDNGSGQLGDNQISGYESHIPVPISANSSGLLNGKTVKQISTGYYHTCALANDDTVYCWGDNGYGQVGDNRASGWESTVPVPISTDGSGLLGGKTIKQISAGNFYTCAIASDNTVYCWGDNNIGQLGDNKVSSYESPIPVPISADGSGLLDGKTVKQISAGQYHTCAIASDNTAYCWGDNGSGQLGDDQASGWESYIPVPISADGSGLLDGKTVKQISISSYHACALASDDQAYCWGDNGDGQLGDNQTSGNESYIPTTVDVSSIPPTSSIASIKFGLLEVTSFTVNSDNSITVITPPNASGLVDVTITTIDGQVVVLTNGYEYITPLTITGIDPSYGPENGGTQLTITGAGFKQEEEWKQISAGTYHTCTISFDNKAYCWGQNTYGQLGNGSTTDSSILVPIDTSGVLSGKTIKQISAGESHTCAIASDDQAYCWGQNNYGQLGNNNTTQQLTPVAVVKGDMPNLTIKQISASGRYYTCAIASNDQGYCWGLNNYGQLGNGTNGTGSSKSVPTAIALGDMPNLTIKQISIGHFHACVISSNDQAYCWGYNDYGRIGNGLHGSGNGSFVPAAVVQGEMPNLKVQQISAGESHTCAIANNNQAYCWGNGIFGRLGNSSTIQRATPVAIVQGEMPDLNVQQISAGGDHTCAIASDNKAYCWGGNDSGQLGNGIPGVSRLVPTPVDSLIILDINGAPAACTNVIVVSDTELTCITSAHLPGLVDVSVTVNGKTATMPAVCGINSGPEAATACNGRLDSGEIRNGDRTNIVSGFLYEEVYISLDLDTNLVKIGGTELTPTTAGVFGWGNNIVTVTTNNNTGYALFISTNQNNSNPNAKDLKHTTLNEYIASVANVCTTSISGSLDPNSGILTNNTWGFTIYPMAVYAQNFCQVPDLDSPLGIKATDHANEAGSSTSIFFGARVDTSKPSGKYQTVVVYTAVAET